MYTLCDLLCMMPHNVYDKKNMKICLWISIGLEKWRQVFPPHDSTCCIVDGDEDNHVDNLYPNLTMNIYFGYNAMSG